MRAGQPCANAYPGSYVASFRLSPTPLAGLEQMAEGFRLNVEGWGPIEEDSMPDRSAEQPSAKKA